MKRTTSRQFTVFAGIGLANTAVYFGVYAALELSMPYLAAHVLAYVVSLTGSFLLNSYVTMRKRPTWQAFFRFPLSGVANLAGSSLLLYLAVGHLRMDERSSALVVSVLVMPVSFVIARWAITTGSKPDIAQPSA